MDSLKSLLGTTFHRHKVKKQAEAGLLVEFVNKLFVEFWGAVIKEKIKAVSFRSGNLKIRVANSILAQEVKFKTKVILTRIKEDFGDDFMVKLVIVQGGIEKSENLY